MAHHPVRPLAKPGGSHQVSSSATTIGGYKRCTKQISARQTRQPWNLDSCRNKYMAKLKKEMHPSTWRVSDLADDNLEDDNNETLDGHQQIMPFVSLPQFSSLTAGDSSGLMQAVKSNAICKTCTRPS